MLTDPTELEFESVYEDWRTQRITQRLAAERLGVSVRTFRRWMRRYQSAGREGLKDKRKTRPHRKASLDEVGRLERLYRSQYTGWNVRHFYESYVSDHGGRRSYTWVKNALQASGLVAMNPPKKGQNRSSRGSCASQTTKVVEPKSSHGVAGTLVYQCILAQQWFPSRRSSLCVALDAATSCVCSGFFVDRVDIWSAFRGVGVTLRDHGLFDQLIENSRFFGQDSNHPDVRSAQSQFRRAMGELGIELIAHGSPRSRGRLARMGRMMRDRLPKELARAKITEPSEANAFVSEYWPRLNARHGSALVGQRNTAFQPLTARWAQELRNVLCLKDSLHVDREGNARYRKRILKIDRQKLRRTNTEGLRVHEYQDGSLELYQDIQLVGQIDANGSILYRDGNTSPPGGGAPA